MNSLTEIGSVPIDFQVLKSVYPTHTAIHNKVSDLEKSGNIIRLKRGLFVVSPQISGQLISTSLIANHIYGPSYISRETALSQYGLIPERVYNTQSMTTKHSRKFTNSFGLFEYIQCSDQYFAIGITQATDKNLHYLMATPEKALCDLITSTPGLILRYKSEATTYLEADLRIDMPAFYKMDVQIMEQCMLYGKKKTSIKLLIQLIEQQV